jgi:hypothetical protein
MRTLTFLPCAIVAACALAVCQGALAVELLPSKGDAKARGLASAARPESSARPDEPASIVVDRLIDAKLAEAKVTPAAQIDDATFVRRLMLDLAGRVPTPVEVRDYVDSKAKNKREQLVDRLLTSPEFVDHQVNELDWMLTQGSGNLRNYLAAALRDDRRWDRIFRDLTLADDEAFEQKDSYQFIKARIKDADQLTNDVSRLFFGVNISCAQCHDHPLAPDWKQGHFYGLKSFFARTYANGDFIGERDYGAISYQTPKGESHPAELVFLTGFKVPEPDAPEPDGKAKKAEMDLLKKLADKKEAPPKPKFSRRSQLAATALRDDQQHFFARSMVNRVWHRLFGQGLVMPVDQMHSANPPSHPELLEWLARDTAENGFDFRRLVRGLVLSRAYSRSSRWESAERPDASLFAVAQVRPLTPAQYAASLRVATESPETFAALATIDEVAKRARGVAALGRGNMASFTPPSDDFQVSVTESLLLANNAAIEADLLSDSKDRLVGYLLKQSEPPARVEAAFDVVFNRTPDADERAVLVEYLKLRSDRPTDAVRQMVWSLLTSSEMRFNY